MVILVKCAERRLPCLILVTIPHAVITMVISEETQKLIKEYEGYNTARSNHNGNEKLLNTLKDIEKFVTIPHAVITMVIIISSVSYRFSYILLQYRTQ